MKRPATKTMVVGHPIVAVPMTLASGVILIAGFQTGSLFPVLIAIAILGGVQTARTQANAYRAWKAEWEAMGDSPARQRATPTKLLGVVVIATLTLLAISHLQLLAYMAGYALGWMGTNPWLLALLFGLGVLVQLVRRLPRHARHPKPVAVVAQAILPVPTLADAYRALPPYCHALLGGER